MRTLKDLKLLVAYNKEGVPLCHAYDAQDVRALLIERAKEARKEKMRERPILFSGEMIQAIESGRKTQTRRVVLGV